MSSNKLITSLVFTFMTLSLPVAAELQLNQKAPFIVTKSIDGKNINTENILGKQPVFLLFFDVWQTPELEAVKKLNAKYGDKISFILLASAMNSKTSMITSAMTKVGITLPVIFDDKHKYFRLFSAWNQPTKILLGKDGRVKLYSQDANIDPEEAIINLLKED